MILKEMIQVPWDIGFYVVPGFSNYRMNDQGVLKNAVGKVIQWAIFKGGGVKNTRGGYRVTNIYGDDGKRKGVSRHRLLGIMFKPCPEDFEVLTVNHKNGIPGDDWLDNLEWSSRGQNNQHAYDNGLRPNGTTPVTLRYWETGIDQWFISIAECARILNKSPSTLEQRLSRNPGVAYSDGLQLKYDDDTPWIDPAVKVAQVRETTKCVAKCVENGELFLHTSVRALSMMLKLDQNVVARRLKEDSSVPYKGFLFKAYTDGPLWPDTQLNSPLGG